MKKCGAMAAGTGRAQCDLRSHGQTHPLIPAVQARHRDGLRRQESGRGAAAPHAGIARMADPNFGGARWLMRRLNFIFIAICMLLIAGSISPLGYLSYGLI